MISRRQLLTGMAGSLAAAGHCRFAAAKSAVISDTGLRGALDARQHGVAAGSADVTRELARLLAKAAVDDLPVYLPPGDYPVSDLVLPDGCRLTGIAGASRLVYAGAGAMVRAEGVRRIELSNLVVDGASRLLPQGVPALLQTRGVENLVIDNCEVSNSARTAVSLEQSGGRISRCRLSGAAEYALYSVNSVDLEISGNTIADCGNGGILIHRWTKGRDGTLVSGNRIHRIGATNGGTGQYGNGINLYRADDVVVSGNHVRESAFSAIRANSASNVLISDNHCRASGETAIYAEFEFEGASITGNLVDGAANGISVVNFNEGGRLATVGNNIVRNLRTSAPYVLEGAIFGVGISAEADTAVTGNVVENAPFWGLGLGFGPYLRNVSVTGNIVRNAGTGCAVTVVEGAGGAIIANNIFQGSTSGAIRGYRWAQAVTEDLAYRLEEPMAAGCPVNTMSPDFLAVNPMGSIPSIDDDGFVLHESLAISLYLARKYGGEIGPKDIAEEALMIQWSLFAATSVETTALKIQSTKNDTDEGKSEIAVAAHALKRPFDVLEKHLSANSHMVGNRFTVADINVAEVVRYAQGHAPLFEQRPALKAWLESCQARPGFKAMWEKRIAEPA
eukprot:g25200.t1